jgi:hypothetical protein
VYKVVVDEVHPDCVYEYIVGSGIVWTPVRTFAVHTPYNISNASEADFRYEPDFLVFGDLGNGWDSQATRKGLSAFVQTGAIDAVLHLGDIAYDLESYFPGVSRAFFKEIEAVASVLPYMVLPGNHEITDDYSQYKSTFRMPVTPANSGSNLFYSFNFGRAHFLMYCSEVLYHSSPERKEQHLEWIKADLETANRNREAVPWVIALAHRPYYCLLNYRESVNQSSLVSSNKDCGYRATRLRGLLEELFYSAAVDLVLHAHVHNYQRTGPLYHNQTVPSAYDEQHRHVNAEAPVFILTGAAGNREGNDLLSPTPQLWSLFQARDLGYGHLKIVNETHLYWEQWDAVSDTRIDYLWLEKSWSRYVHKEDPDPEPDFH